MSARYDRRIVQAIPTEDLREYQNRVNEALRQLSEQILKLEGRAGEVTSLNALRVKAPSYTLAEFESSVAGSAALVAYPENPDSPLRGVALAKGAKRDSTGQWVATDTGAAIMELYSDGKIKFFADTELLVGAAFSPTLVSTIP